MDQFSGGNSANNPRMDLLHGSGNNQQVVPPAPAPEPTYANIANPVAPTQPVAPVNPVAPAIQPLKLDKASGGGADTPPPVPPNPTPEPRPVPPVPPSGGGNHHGPVIAGIIIALLLLAGAGIGGWWFLTQRQQNNTAQTPTQVEVQVATPTDLAQATSSGNTVEAGATTSATSLSLQFSVTTTANSGSLTPEVEVQPVGTAFTGTPTATGDAVSANGHDMNFRVSASNLKEGKYHWQARVSKDGQSGDWAGYGSDPTAAAFIIDATAPAAPAVTNVSTKKVANPLTLTTNRPEFNGTGEPGSKIAITIGPDNTVLNATVGPNGAWSVTPTTDVANGQHDVSIIATDAAGNASQPTKLALSINPATAADTSTRPTAPAATPSTPQSATPTPTPTPTQLAPTGDGIGLPTVISVMVFLLAIGGFAITRRRHASF